MKIVSAELVPVYLHNLDLADRYKVNDHIVTLQATVQFTLLDKSWTDIYLQNIGNKATTIINYKFGMQRITTMLANYLYQQKYFTPMNRTDFQDYFSFDSDIDWEVFDPNREIFQYKRKMYFALGDFISDKMLNRNATRIEIKRSMANKYQLAFSAKSLSHGFPTVLYSADFHRDFEALAAKVSMEILYDNRKVKKRVKDEHLKIDRTLQFEPEVDSRKNVIRFFVKSPLKFFLRSLTGFDFGKEWNYDLGHMKTTSDAKAIESKFLAGKFKL